MVGEPADVVGCPEEPVDTLASDAVARPPFLLDQAVVDEFADVLADGLARHADFPGDLPLADCGLALGDLDEDPEPRRGPLVVEDVDHVASVFSSDGKRYAVGGSAARTLRSTERSEASS